MIFFVSVYRKVCFVSCLNFVQLLESVVLVHVKRMNDILFRELYNIFLVMNVHLYLYAI